MGVVYGKIPSIPTNGLVLNLDAENTSSYSGTGSTWFDISDNSNNGTITGSVPYNSTRKVFTFSGTQGNYINVPSPNLSSTNFTVIGAARYANTSVNTLRIISGLSNNWLMGHWNNSSENLYSEGWVTPVGNGPKDDQWRILASTGNISADSYASWVNGVKLFENNGGAAGPNGFGLGRYAGGDSEYTQQGEISFLLAYNRILTDTEIIRVTSVYKGRFGL